MMRLHCCKRVSQPSFLDRQRPERREKRQARGRVQEDRAGQEMHGNCPRF